MFDVLPLGSVLNGRHRGDDLIAWDGTRPIFANELVNDVAGLSLHLSGRAGEKWGLYCESSYHFLVGLLAMLHAEINPVLPMNAQPDVIRTLNEGVSGFVSDVDLACSHIALPVSAVSATEIESVVNSITAVRDFSETKIEIYTSGSTGEADVIPKNIGQFESEVSTLELTWGDKIVASCFVATVSHQHIYGLLFRLLWPVCSGRAFCAKRFEFPEDLSAVIKRLYESYGTKTIIVSSPAHIKRVSDGVGLNDIGTYAELTFSSGGPLTFDSNVTYQTLTGSAVVEVFGSSETGGVGFRAIACGDQEGAESSLWKPLSGVQIRQSIENNQLQVKSPYCFANDWFEMGDVVSVGVDGRFTLRGRADRIAKIEEKRISLSGMEALLLKHDWVHEAKVLVLEGKRQCLGVVACLSNEGVVALRAGKKRDVVLVLKSYLEQVFESVLLPRKWRFVSELPINTQGKTVVGELQALFLMSEVGGGSNDE